MNDNERFNVAIKYIGKSINSIAKEIGISQPTLKACMDGTNKPSFDTIKKLIIAYPEINPTWILTGTGEMLLKKEDISLNRFTQEAKKYDSVFKNALTWIVFSDYEKETGIQLSSDIFIKIANDFNLAAAYAETIQKSFETELLIDLYNKLSEYGKIDGKNPINLPDPLKKVLDKYSEIYSKLEKIRSDIMTIVKKDSIQKEILEYIKSKS